MKKIIASALLILAFIAPAGCENVAETILVGGAEVPYHKLGLTMFPRNRVMGGLSAQMADIKSLGVNYIRVDFSFDLDYMPTASSSPNFSGFDDIVSAASNAGLEILPILAYLPEWLDGNQDWKSVYINEYVIPVVSRYKNSVKYWEIWNEPDEITRPEGFTTDVLDGTPEDYFDLLKRASTAIRSLDSSAIVVSAATASITADGFDKFNWMEKLVDLGLSRYADILNIHYYSELDIELSFKGGPLVKGAGMRVWVTETGKRGQSNHLSYFKREMAYIDKSLNPERIYWYCYVEGHLTTDVGIHPDDTYGLLTYYGGAAYESPLYTHLKSP